MVFKGCSTILTKFRLHTDLLSCHEPTLRICATCDSSAHSFFIIIISQKREVIHMFLEFMQRLLGHYLLYVFRGKERSIA